MGAREEVGTKGAPQLTHTDTIMLSVSDHGMQVMAEF